MRGVVLAAQQVTATDQVARRPEGERQRDGRDDLWPDGPAQGQQGGQGRLERIGSNPVGSGLSKSRGTADDLTPSAST